MIDRSYSFRVTLTREERDWLQQEADHQGLRMTDIVRSFIKRLPRSKSKDITRTKVELSEDAAEILECLAATQKITQSEALRKAIATEAYLSKEIGQGSKLLLLTSDKEVREVLFR